MGGFLCMANLTCWHGLWVMGYGLWASHDRMHEAWMLVLVGIGVFRDMGMDIGMVWHVMVGVLAWV